MVRGDCPKCESKGSVVTYRTIEGTDRDGTRGVAVTWHDCENCDYLGETVKEI